jgi:hypothetical protein
MVLNVHYLTRQAARETKAARQAVTETARQRHLRLADQYALQAQELHESKAHASG